MWTSSLQYVAGTAWGEKKGFEKSAKTSHWETAFSFSLSPFRSQASMNGNFYELVIKMHFALWCNCFQKSCGLYKARESFEKLAFSVFTLTPGICLQFFSSTEPTCCTSADWYLFWAVPFDPVLFKELHSLDWETYPLLNLQHIFLMSTTFNCCKSIIPHGTQFLGYPYASTVQLTLANESWARCPCGLHLV